MSRRRLPPAVQLALDRSEAEDTRPRADRIAIRLDFPPTVNHVYRPFKDGAGRARIGMTTEGRHYKAASVKTIGTHMIGLRPPLPPYRLTIRAIPPNNARQHDIDNLVKIVSDSLFEAIGGNDNDVVEIHAYKEPPDAWSRVEVTLEGET